MRARIAARPNLTAAALFAVAALVFVGQGVLPGRTLSNSDSFWFKSPWAAGKPSTLVRPANPEFDDAPAVLQPFVRFTKASLPDIPLWNPHIMSGRPFEANAQSAIFSPFNVPAYLLPFFTALGWIAALKLWTAAFGMFLLGRRLGMRSAGATVAGVIYGFNLWMVTWLSYPHSSVWALIPWLMIAAERTIRRPDVRGAAPLAVLVALQFFCGHPESSFHALLATTIFAVIRMSTLHLGWRRPLAALAGAAALGTALAAVTLIPFLQLLLSSADIHQRSYSAQHIAAAPAMAIVGLMPDWFGRPTQYEIALFELGRAWYGSALALMLAGAAVILRPSRGRLLIAGLGVACMMVVLAIPPVYQIVVHLPIFSSGHNSRLAILALFCLALLAGFGIDDLLAHTSTLRRRRLVLAVSAGLFLLPVAYVVLRNRSAWSAAGHGFDVAWGFMHAKASWADLPDVARASALWMWVGLAGAGLIVIALAGARRRWAGPTVVAVLAVLVIYGDLARMGMGYNPAIKQSIATQPVTPAIRLLQTAGTARIVGMGDIPQNALAMNYGLYEPRGYDLPIEQRYDHLWRSTMSPEAPAQGQIQDIPLSLFSITPQRVHALGVMGTRFLIQPEDQPRLHTRGLRLVHSGPDAQVYRDLDEQPRAAVVGAQIVAPSGEAALRTVVAPNFRIDRAAVTETAITGLPTTTAAFPPPPAGRARIAVTNNDSLVVDAEAKRAGMVVVSDSWAPGWTATVDGRSAKVHRVDYVYRGVTVGPGRHRVVFRYRPVTWTIGWIVSVLALLALLAACGASWWRARRGSTAR